MKFIDYYTSLSAAEKRLLAARLETSVPYLSQIAHEKRSAGPKFLLNIKKATKGKVTPEEIRADIALNPSRAAGERNQPVSEH